MVAKMTDGRLRYLDNFFFAVAPTADVAAESKETLWKMHLRDREYKVNTNTGTRYLQAGAAPYC